MTPHAAVEIGLTVGIACLILLDLRATVLVWLIPGMFALIRYELDPPREPDNDPTVPRVDRGVD